MRPLPGGLIKSDRRGGSAGAVELSTESSPAWRLVIKGQKRDEVLAKQATAESHEPDVGYPVEQVAMVNDE